MENAVKDTLAELGLKDKSDLPPFLEMFKEEHKGKFVAGIIEAPHAIKFKVRGQPVTKMVHGMTIKKTNVEGYKEGDRVTISPPGLLAFQLSDEERPAGVVFPVNVLIEYKGKDEEDRHQTKVYWPESK